jgi:hypothetical protein
MMMMMMMMMMMRRRRRRRRRRNRRRRNRRRRMVIDDNTPAAAAADDDDDDTPPPPPPNPFAAAAAAADAAADAAAAAAADHDDDNDDAFAGVVDIDDDTLFSLQWRLEDVLQTGVSARLQNSECASLLPRHHRYQQRWLCLSNTEFWYVRLKLFKRLGSADKFEHLLSSKTGGIHSF